MNQTTHQPAFAPLPRLITTRPWRLGVSSYVYPANLHQNVAAVAGSADDVELVLFQTPDLSNLPTAHEAEELGHLARDAGMTFSVHFPIEFRIGDPDASVREAFVTQARQLIDLTRNLPLWCYILHLEGIAPDASQADINRWQQHCRHGIERLLDSGIQPDMFTVENLSAPFEWCWPLVQQYGLSVCTDIGHLWRAGHNLRDHWRKYATQTRLIHLHGEKAGQDHISLTCLEQTRLQDVREILNTFTGVVTLELFDYQHTATSIDILNQLLRSTP